MSLCAVLVSACSAKEPKTETYFDRTISPILQSSCVSTNTGANCHVTQERGNALGNLSLATYRDLIKRRDLLINYGPYGLPNMLLKTVDPFDIVLTSYDGTPITVHTDIRHAGGKTLGLTTAGFHTLKAWIASGASENNAVVPPPTAERDPCSDAVPTDPAFDPNSDPQTDDYEQFRSTVHPVLAQNCAAGNCHGSGSNSLRLVCQSGGAGADVLARWNYFASVQYLATRAGELGTSEILRRPLDPAAGGAYHEGGAIFPSQADPGYTAILEWANTHGPNTNIPRNRGFDFFAKRVQPMLVKKGCMAIGCHSPAMFHDYRLRGGSGGNFSVPTTTTNYELTREQIALETPDPSASRLIAKNLLRPDQQTGGRGILHRGGALFDDFTGSLASPQLCDFPAAETGALDEQHAYCVITRWIQIEREEAGLTPLSGMVYVKRRPIPVPDAPQDFARYSGSSDLCFSPLTMDAATGVITGSGGACRSLITACAGLSPQTADIRHPSLSWKGDKIAFAARSSESEPFAVWTVNVDGSACQKNAAIAQTPSAPGWTDNGALVHNFDPAFTPDDRIVFASTRGNVMNMSAFDYHGPTRTPADPSRWNANLYVFENGGVRQLTFLLNQELSPAMMSDGRVIFTSEKRAPGFYQLAGRRINVDGGDYHPLYAQRGTIGYQQMTEVVELANKNFAAIFGDRGAAHGAGTVGVFNRSIGPDQLSSDPADYTVDPGAIGWPVDNFYLHSLHIVDGAVSGHVGTPSSGAYRSPSPLPNGQMLVSFAANAADLGNFNGNFDIYMMDPITGQKTPLTSDAANDELSAVAVYQRANRGIFDSRPDEANGHTRVYKEGEDSRYPTDISDVTILDARVLAALLFQNTRSGLANPDTQRKMPDIKSLEVYEDLPPAPGETDLSAHTGSDAYGSLYARRRLLGSIPILSDGSAHVVLPGGVPVILRGNFELAGGPAAARFQRESMQFYPGEYAHQSFPARFFDGFCGGCHGSVSGAEVDLSLQPDILTQASRVEARKPTNMSNRLNLPPGQRGAEVGPVD